MSLVSLLILGFVLRTVTGLRAALRGLTARSSTGWAATSCTVAMAAVGMRLLPIPAGITSGIHSIAAALLLTPLVDVLGARHPGNRVWPWFVIVPMLLMLLWPTISHLFSESVDTPVAISLPATGGFLLVLVMGTGNHFGTANHSACLAGAVGILLFTLPVTEWCAWPGDSYCLASSISLAIAALLIEGRLRSTGDSAGHQRLWVDFRDIYGIVWARRVMDRINQFADREQWNIVMTLDGFRTRKESVHVTDISERPEEILRWVLRRFADDEFLDRYLAKKTQAHTSDTGD